MVWFAVIVGACIVLALVALGLAIQSYVWAEDLRNNPYVPPDPIVLRDATVYLSDSGDDDSDGLTPTTAKRSMCGAVQAIDTLRSQATLAGPPTVRIIGPTFHAVGDGWTLPFAVRVTSSDGLVEAQRLTTASSGQYGALDVVPVNETVASDRATRGSFFEVQDYDAVFASFQPLVPVPADPTAIQIASELSTGTPVPAGTVLQGYNPGTTVVLADTSSFFAIEGTGSIECIGFQSPSTVLTLARTVVVEAGVTFSCPLESEVYFDGVAFFSPDASEIIVRFKGGTRCSNSSMANVLLDVGEAVFDTTIIGFEGQACIVNGSNNALLNASQCQLFCDGSRVNVFDLSGNSQCKLARCRIFFPSVISSGDYAFRLSDGASLDVTRSNIETSSLLIAEITNASRMSVSNSFVNVGTPSGATLADVSNASMANVVNIYGGDVSTNATSTTIDGVAQPLTWGTIPTAYVDASPFTSKVVISTS